ncbi:protein LKAAEAR1 [Lissotriton helveticus]
MAGKGTGSFKENPGAKFSRSSTDVDQKKMTHMQRVRYLAYEKPSKEVEMSVLSTRNRLREDSRALQAAPRLAHDAEQIRQANVVGQLKAAEARNRVRVLRLRYQSLKSQEINQMIASQPTAMDSVRLQVFLPPQHDIRYPPDPLGRAERERVETILTDDSELTYKRII